MANIILITGGQRSGKSRRAQEIALEMSDKPIYIATARIWDDDFRQRIEKHKADRDHRWTTIEEEKHLSNLALPEKSVVVLDCITLWITNIFDEYIFQPDEALEVIKKEWDNFIQKDITILAVSNEIGMGTHATTEASRKFADLQGWVNQYIASFASEVYLMVAGIPLKIK